MGVSAALLVGAVSAQDFAANLKGKPMVAFKMTDTNGKTITNQSLKGKVVLLDFWATWCGPCRAFGPTFEKASEANPDVYFAKVDIDQNPDLAAAAKVQAVPTLMVVKKQQIIFQQAGALRASDLDDLISQAKALDMDAAASDGDTASSGDAKVKTPSSQSER